MIWIQRLRFFLTKLLMIDFFQKGFWPLVVCNRKFTSTNLSKTISKLNYFCLINYNLNLISFMTQTLSILFCFTVLRPLFLSLSLQNLHLPHSAAENGKIQATQQSKQKSSVTSTFGKKIHGSST